MSLPEYELFGCLGVGSYGSVWSARQVKTGRQVAIKVVERERNSDQAIQQELKVWREVSGHPNIISLYDFSTAKEIGGDGVPVLPGLPDENRDHGCCYFVCELAPGGNLLTHMERKMKPLTESEAHTVIRQVAGAVLQCHQRGYCHRDVKLENVLLGSRDLLKLKLTDFGLSVPIVKDPAGHRVPCTVFAGSPLYTPPEIYMKIPFDPVEADVWSLGVLLYILVTLRMPFPLVNNVVHFCPPAPPPHVTGEMSELISGMLKFSVEERWSMERVMGHPWMVRGPRGSLMKLQCAGRALGSSSSLPSPSPPPSSPVPPLPQLPAGSSGHPVLWSGSRVTHVVSPEDSAATPLPSPSPPSSPLPSPSAHDFPALPPSASPWDGQEAKLYSSHKEKERKFSLGKALKGILLKVLPKDPKKQII